MFLNFVFIVVVVKKNMVLMQAASVSKNFKDYSFVNQHLQIATYSTGWNNRIEMEIYVPKKKKNANIL